MKAKIEDLRLLKEKIKTHMSLCSFMDMYEKEYMVGMTVHAAVNTFDDGYLADEENEAYSIRGNVESTIDSGKAYDFLCDQGYFIEEARGDETVIFVTQKLVDALNSFFGD